MSEETEKQSISVPKELLNAFIEGRTQLSKLNDAAQQTSRSIYDIQKKKQDILDAEETIMKQNNSINRDREVFEKGLQDLLRQMEDTCKLDRNKNWAIDLDKGLFTEVPAQEGLQ